MASKSECESRGIEAANASGTTQVVFLHRPWLLPRSRHSRTPCSRSVG